MGIALHWWTGGLSPRPSYDRECTAEVALLYLETSLLFQIRDQVRHLLRCDGGFEAFGHEGDARAGEGLDLAAKHGVGAAVGAFEGEVACGFAGDEAGEGATVVGFDDVESEVGRDFAVGVEDVGENLFCGPGLDGAEVGADVVAAIEMAVADHAEGFVDFGTAGGVSGH